MPNFNLTFPDPDVELSNFAVFSTQAKELTLVDIVNDAAQQTVRYIDREAHPNQTHENDFSIDAPGSFVYELDLVVNEQRVYYLNITSLDVNFYLNNPTQQLSAGRRSWVDGVWVEFSRRQRARNEDGSVTDFISAQEKPILSARIDLDVPLANPNLEFGDVSSNNDWGGAIPPPPPTRRTRMLLGPGAGIQEVIAGRSTGFMRPGVIEAFPSAPMVRLTKAGQNSSKLFKNSIRMLNDPLNMLAAPPPLYPTLSAKFGLESGRINSSPLQQAPAVVAHDDIKVRYSLAQIRENLREQIEDHSDNAVRLANSVCGNNNVSLGASHRLGREIIVQNSQRRIRRRFEIDKHVLGDRASFFVEIIPIVRPPTSVLGPPMTMPTVIEVGHKSQCNNLLIPQFPPQISLVRNSRAHIVLRIKKVDPVPHNVAIVRSYYSPHQTRAPLSISELIRELTFAEGSTEIVSDTGVQNILPNQVMYRAIVQIGLMNQAGPSSGLCVPGLDSLFSPAPMDPNSSLVITAINELSRVRIEVRNIPDGVVSLRLLREDLSSTGDLSDRVSVISTGNDMTMQLNPEGEQLIFYDNDTIVGRKYRYFVAMQTRIGPEFLSEKDEIFIRIRSAQNLPATVSIQSPVLEGTNENPIVSMNLIVTENNEGLDYVLFLLRKQGVSTSFINAISAQRSALSSLVVFIIERVNMTTGRRVSFGVQTPGLFSDNPVSRLPRNIPAPRPGSKYVYYAKVCVRPIESLLYGIFTTFGGENQPGITEKTALAQKFLSVYNEQHGGSPGGALPAVSDLIEQPDVGASLSAGQTGHIFQGEIIIPIQKSRPISLTVSAINGDPELQRLDGIPSAGTDPNSNILLQWNADTQGDVSLIDFCLVFASLNGQNICIGTVATSGHNRDFRFLDKVYCKQLGRITYTVKFVYKDLSVSEPSAEVSINYLSYTPAPLRSGQWEGVIEPAAVWFDAASDAIQDARPEDMSMGGGAGMGEFIQSEGSWPF